MRTLKAYVAISALVLYAQPGLAKKADFVDVGKTFNQSLGTWAIGDGDQVVVQTLCTASANYDNPFAYPPPPETPPAVHEPYHFKITELATPPAYYLYLNGVDTNVGNARIPVQFEHQDTMQPVGYETLTEDVYDSHYHQGQFKNCRNGDNSQFQMTLSATDLQAAKAGNYSATFRAGAIGGSSGTATSTSDFSVSITVSPAVQISGLSDIGLGTWAGGVNKTATAPFCVYSNNAGATYGITITSANQNASSSFNLVNATGTAIPYTLQFADSVGGAGTTVAGSTLSGVGNNSLPGCGGVYNAQLSVTVLAANLQAAPTDSYSDTITLVVVPQ